MSNNKDMIRFFDFSVFHNKRPPAGSTKIRVRQLIKYWPEAGLYKYGENPDVLILQKVYVNNDYKFIKHFENIKILDICDPDWLDGLPIKETIDAVDAVTCPTTELAEFLKQMTDKPVRVIADRFDLEQVPPAKEHTGRAKRVVWFGYRHNAEFLKSVVPLIKEHNLELLVISNDDPITYQYDKDIRPLYTYKKYPEDEKEFYKLMQTADFAVMPKGNRPQDRFKSNNRKTKSILAGLPVANNKEEFYKYLDPEPRNEYIKQNRDKILRDYDCRVSVKDYKELIQELKND